MQVLHITPAFYPATYYGGPIFSTFAMCNALALRSAVTLRVLSSDMAGPKLSQRLQVDAVPVRYAPGYDVYFERRTIGSDITPTMLAQIAHMTQWADVVWLTGTYSFPTIPTLLACRLRNKPLVWSPRGALKASHEWSGVRRPGAKRMFELACRQLKPDRCSLHVTSDIEMSASLARLPNFAGALIANGVEMPTATVGRSWRDDNVTRLLFLGRLDKVKGIENLLHALTTIQGRTTLDIYGTGDATYVGTLNALVARLGLTSRVTFHGHVEGDEKSSAFLRADIFVLPSHTENFGMVVAEALAHGVPAIVSRGAPWAELEARGAGLWVNNEPHSLARAVDSLTQADLPTMGARGRAWMRDEFSWEQRAREMMTLFESLLASENTP